MLVPTVFIKSFSSNFNLELYKYEVKSMKLARRGETAGGFPSVSFTLWVSHLKEGTIRAYTVNLGPGWIPACSPCIAELHTNLSTREIKATKWVGFKSPILPKVPNIHKYDKNPTYMTCYPRGSNLTTFCMEYRLMAQFVSFLSCSVGSVGE